MEANWQKATEAALTCKSAEEVLSVYQNEGIALEKEDADYLFSKLNETAEMQDDALKQVVGGTAGGTEEITVHCQKCGGVLGRPQTTGRGYRIYKCPHCQRLTYIIDKH